MAVCRRTRALIISCDIRGRNLSMRGRGAVSNDEHNDCVDADVAGAGYERATPTTSEGIAKGDRGHDDQSDRERDSIQSTSSPAEKDAAFVDEGEGA